MFVGFGIVLYFFWFVRARADEGEFALQYVEELREFVEAEFAEQFSDARETRVIFDFEKRAVGAFIEMGE